MRAMAASTWFHASAWPPGNHGISPSASCTSAMASTVVATSSASMMPGTSGSSTGGLDREEAGGLAQRRVVGGEVLEHLGSDHAVEGAVGKGQGQGVTACHPAARQRRALAHLLEAGEDGGRLLQLVPVAVEGDDARAAPVGLEGVTSPPASQVEQPIAGPQTQAVVVDRQHCAPACSAMARRY